MLVENHFLLILAWPKSQIFSSPRHLQQLGSSTRKSPLHLYSLLAACGISGGRNCQQSVKYAITKVYLLGSDFCIQYFLVFAMQK